jgi:hypothetical protein
VEPDPGDKTLLAQAWPRTEQAMVNRADGGKISFQAGEASTLVDAVRRAMRVEVQTAEHGLKYVLLFDVDSDDGPNPAYYVMSKLEKVEQLAKRHTPHRIRRVPTEVRIVPRDEAVAGVICPRLMTAYRGTPWVNPDLPPGWA